jgi:hypothetical protein
LTFSPNSPRLKKHRHFTLADVRFGPKAELRRLNGMSALPPKADITGRDEDVRFVPKAYMVNERSSALFHLHHATVVLHLHTAAPDGRSRG